MRVTAAGLLTDPVDALAIRFFGNKLQLELLAHGSAKKAAHRVLLPPGRLHDGRNGRPLRPPQQFDDFVLLRVRMAFPGSRLAGSSLRLPGSRFTGPVRWLLSLVGG